MQVIARFLLLIVMAISGLLLIVCSLPWLAYLLDDAPPPSRSVDVVWIGLSASILVLYTAIRLYQKLDRWRQRRLERHRQNHADVLLSSAGLGLAVEARGSLAPPLLLIALTAVSGFSVYAAVDARHWGMLLLSLMFLFLFLGLGWQHLIQLLRPGPLLRMDTHCINHAMYGPIPWRQVVGMELQISGSQYGKSHLLLLGVRDAARYLHHAPVLLRWAHGHRLKHANTTGTLSIPLDSLAEDSELLYQSARILRERTGAPLLPFWHPQMDDQDIDTALHMQTLTDEMQAMPSLPQDATPAQIAAFEALGRTFLERQQALLPELDAAARAHVHKIKRNTRNLRVVMWLVLVAMVISLALQAYSRW